MAVYRGGAHPFERTRPFGLAAAALGLGSRATDQGAAAIGRLLAGRAPRHRGSPGTSSSASSRRSSTSSRRRASTARCC
jgi:hypothetical protein